MSLLNTEHSSGGIADFFAVGLILKRFNVPKNSALTSSRMSGNSMNALKRTHPNAATEVITTEAIVQVPTVGMEHMDNSLPPRPPHQRQHRQAFPEHPALLTTARSMRSTMEVKIRMRRMAVTRTM